MIHNQLIKTFKEKGIPFRANDSISEYLDDFHRKVLEQQLEQKFKEVLDILLIDTENDPNTKETPHRLAKMFMREIMAGRYLPKPAATSFPNDNEYKYDGMLVIRAELVSLCAHHFQPMNGLAYIGIIPNGNVLGLSKYIRIAQWCAARGQIQEQLCNQIADEIVKEINAEDIAVYLAMKHGCVENRGVHAHSSLTQTTVLRGRFKEFHVKNEFMHDVSLQESHKI